MHTTDKMKPSPMHETAASNTAQQKRRGRVETYKLVGLSHSKNDSVLTKPMKTNLQPHFCCKKRSESFMYRTHA